MQTIPLIYSVLNEQKLCTGPADSIDGVISVKDPDLVSRVDSLKPRVERGKVMVADAVGLGRGRFNAPFIEHCKVSGNDLWLIEPVYDDVDVLDAFIGSADKLVFPYRHIRNDGVLPDILDISDNCVPMLICRNGKDGRYDPLETVRKLSETGFHNIMVEDTDGSFDAACWESLHDECGGLICYSPSKDIGSDVPILAKDVFPFTVKFSR